MTVLAWMCVRRFHARGRREVRAREEVESSDSNHAHNRKKMEIRAQSTKPSATKSSVLQSIYGEISAFFLAGWVNMDVYMTLTDRRHLE